ncbi:MAG: hypothetical protein PHD48_09635 [Alphaproteobacteria bacterium]|nr:hypothetical protein [Alphaproteobacteria bacterium]
MNKDEQLRFSLMLAFQTVTAQDKRAQSEASVKKIIAYAKLINEFCNLHLTQTFPEQTIKLPDDRWVTQVDAAINQHIEDLQKREQTKLPTDRETLIQYYDRLQQRKVRRSQWLFYAQATTEELADLVLKYMDEEIEEKNSEGYQ